MRKFDEFENFDNNEKYEMFGEAELDDYIYENGDFVKKDNELQSNNLKDKKENTMKQQKEEKNENKNYGVLKDIFRIIGLVISGVVLVVSLLTAYKSFVPAQSIDTTILSYNLSNAVDYRVNLLDNDFYETKSLGKGELVPVTFIDDIEIDFSSYLSASKVINVNYNYQITGEIVAKATDNGKEGSGGKIWTKNYSFVPSTALVSTGTGYNVSKSVTIDYKIYNDLVNQYKLQASVPMDVVLNVTMKVNAIGNFEDKVLNENNSVTVTIPLSVSTVMIKSDTSEPTQKDLVDTEVIPANNNYVLLGISIALALASLVVIVLLLKKVRKMTEDHSLMIKFNRIMKDFNQVIIEIDELPRVKGAAVIKVKTFKDMLDIEKELHLPIMCAKSKEGILTDNVFYIVNHNQIFEYRLNGDPERF